MFPLVLQLRLLLVFCISFDVCWTNRLHFREKRDSNQNIAVTNLELGRYISHVLKKVKDVDNKLFRHELREKQAADSSARVQNTLNSDHEKQQKNMQIVAAQLIKLDKTIFALDSVVKTVDERQKILLTKMQEISRRQMESSTNSASKEDINTILSKMNAMDDILMRKVKGVNNEVKIVGESLRQHMEQLNARQDRLSSDWTTCQIDQIRALTEVTSSLSQTESHFAEQITQSNGIVKLKSSSINCEETSNGVMGKLSSLDKAYQNREQQYFEQTEKIDRILEIQNANLLKLLNMTKLEEITVEKSFKSVLNNLDELQSKSDNSMNSLIATIKRISGENTQKLSEKIENANKIMKKKSETILYALEDAASMSENIQFSLTENFEDLTRDIKSLKKVEKVMMSTADAVLDTKRSIEFGIKQVIIELGDIVKTSGDTINRTLSERINQISFDIVRNQSSAITEMTSKMENEISQVWRQIGIMYQQVSKTVNILYELQDSTAQSMNASLNQVGNIDGTVGNINGKVADMEDNLNYLLGKLSLVSSEFSNMKYGVGAELDKLRAMTKEFSNKEQQQRKNSIDYDQ